MTSRTVKWKRFAASTYIVMHSGHYEDRISDFKPDSMVGQVVTVCKVIWLYV